MRKFISFALMALFSTSLWAGVNVFSGVSQVIADGDWTIVGSSADASSQSSVVFPSQAAEEGFPTGTQAKTDYYCKLSSTTDLGAKLSTSKRVTIKGLSEGDSIVIYWFVTSTTGGNFVLSYATAANKGAKLTEVATGTLNTKQIYATSFPALTASDIEHIEEGYVGTDSLLYISASGPSPYIYAVKLISGEKHTLTWNFAGGSSSATAGTDYTAGGQVAKGATITYPANNTMTKEGKDFNGWDTVATTMPDKDLTITAQWVDHEQSSDATLSDLKVNGTTVTGFAAATVEYNVELPFGTTVVPTVTATANSAYAKSVIVTQASSVSGVASVVVTAENNSTKTYTINFSVASSKDLLLVFRTSIAACVGTPSVSDAILSNDASVSTYINQISFDNVEGTGDNGKETGGKSGSLDVGKKAGNMFTLSVKKGYAFKEMSFKGKIQDPNCEYSLDGGEWTTLTSTDTSNDDCYNPFSDAEVTQFRLRSTGNSGVWIRNMQLTIINSNKTPTSLDNTTSELNAIKRIENGQVVIFKDGKYFNVLGIQIR